MSSLNLDPKSTGKKHWKSLEELGASEEFHEYLEREFPEEASELGSGFSRRRFLQVMGAGMALAGVSGCDPIRRPVSKILPYNKMPESLIPGKAQFYATTYSLRGEAVGLLVESHEGRPTKIEGNPQHPASLGSTHRQQQAAVLDLYNPDRSQKPLKKGIEATWLEFWKDSSERMNALKATGGEGLRFLSGYNTSPSFLAIWNEAKVTFPKAKWVVYEPSGRDASLMGLQKATGKSIEPAYHLENAKRILSVDADFTESEVGAIVHSKALAKTRNPDLGKDMSRLYVIEAQFSATGGMADHRLRVKASLIEPTLIQIAKALAAQGIDFSAYGVDVSQLPGDAAGLDPAWISAVALDLASKKGESVVVVGRHQSAFAHALGLAINLGLGAVGKTVNYHPSTLADLNPELVNDTGISAFAGLLDELDKGSVELLVVLDLNPAYVAPADLNAPARLQKAKAIYHLGLEVDETASLSEWHLPMSHFLEEWSDAQGHEGTLSVAQPLIEPLYETLGRTELLAALTGNPLRKGHDIVQSHWKKKFASNYSEKNWRKWLHEGLVENSSSAAIIPTISKDGFSALTAGIKAPKSGGLEIVFREHPNVGDGRFANNPWLQEAPAPITKLTWDNAALMGPALIKKLGLHDMLLNKHDTGTTMGDYRKRPMVKITLGGRTLEAVAWVLPGLADETILIHTGYGRSKVGKVGEDTGFNAYSLMTSDSYDFASGVEVSPTGELYAVACTQDHWSIMGRPIVREGGLAEYEENKSEFASEEKWNEHPPEENLWENSTRGDFDFSKGMQWGMVIDFNSCTGCNACVVACQAENNIPTVGKEQVLRGREMHWIRIDRYFSGEVENPEVVYQVMACQQCENAPCEEVCPVAATSHSHEGLNDMAYNRCIGTRYCSNNCPYKVRRFNFFNFTKKWNDTTERFQKNPDVTVRFRGVMEKCTYCVQRINRARIVSKNQGVEIIPDGSITPACAQACPADAITFGNINDPESRVAKLKAHPRNYGVLRDINTRPRTSYLARVRNPNPALEKTAKAEKAHA